MAVQERSGVDGPEAGFSVYADKIHPLANRSSINESDLQSYEWVNHKFEFGLYESGSMPDTRDYALKVNSLLNTVQVIRGTELLISVSSGFTSLFDSFGLTKICSDVTRPILPSGAIHWGSLDEKPHIRKFVSMTKSFLTDRQSPSS